MTSLPAPPTVELLSRSGAVFHVGLSGAFTVGAPHTEKDVFALIDAKPERIVLDDQGITDWDSGLLVYLLRWRRRAAKEGVDVDVSNLPAGAVRLLQLAEAVPERGGGELPKTRPGLFTRVGLRAMNSQRGFISAMAFLGEIALALGRYAAGRGRYRRADMGLLLRSCGPQALGIVGLISFLVGAILAFVGAVQLKMFGAEIFVASLVGLGMVMEMGALMTGILLAGRTGAAFAAQLGTMQVNEEVDALQTLGIPPMDYLVLPRVLALAVMTPLLVIYANTVGILGGSFVGILILNLSPAVYFTQTFELMTPWLASQGLIKGSTFGILVALCGCYRGLRCGRSASAVGEATTGAVVSSIVAIVIADAVWTFIFMVYA
jgi:phospholipid/cholesterol/gamma-HCH transport system permease protein